VRASRGMRTCFQNHPIGQLDLSLTASGPDWRSRMNSNSDRRLSTFATRRGRELTSALPVGFIAATMALPLHAQRPMTHDERPTTSDEFWMEEALRAAQRALEAGEVPVGAIVVCAGEIVGRGWNRNLTDSDPTAHAEIVALRQAGANLGNHRLGDCELFATIEPCPMCAGALVHARLKRLVYGADDPKAGAVHSVMEVLNHPQLNHRTEVRGGVLAGRCAELLQSFFRSRRGEGR
jgi:tRNA(adenine34) deaminase